MPINTNDKVPQNPPEQDSVKKAIKRVSNPKHAASLTKRAANTLAKGGPEALWRAGSYRYDLMTKGESWKFRADIPLSAELRAQRKKMFAFMPHFSIIVPLYNTPKKFLKEMIKSVLSQSYRYFELVLIDASDAQNKYVSEVVKSFGDKRIQLFRIAKNEGISANTNIGFSEAEGNYYVLLDHDDCLAKNALFELTKAINEKNADFIYSDEIVLSSDMKKLGEYHFKPDYSPDYLLNCNYITHICAFKKELLQEVGALDSAFDGAQDYDLILRLTKAAKNIVHIPKVLYYWRRHDKSTAKDINAKPEAIEAGKNAIKAHLEREKIDAEVFAQEKHPGAYRIKYALKSEPIVSIIIPNKDHVEDLKRCIASIVKHANYKKTEIIIVENNSTQKETIEFYKQLRTRMPSIKLLRYSGEFNFSAINNFAVNSARGEHVLLLNNDVQILSDGFIEEMLSYSMRDDVGAVGAKLFFPDNTIQHAGVFIGINGSAGHSHKSHAASSGGDMYRLCTTQNFSAVTGACLMVKKSLYLEMGGLDSENFAVAYNDIDFCLKLREKGLLNVMTPFAYAYHHESKSRGYDENAGGEKQKRYEKERENFRNKYGHLLNGNDPYYNPHFTMLYENYGYK